MTKRTPRTVDLLKYSKNLLKDGHWIQGDYAQDTNFCLMGAVEAATCVLDASSIVGDRAIKKIEKILNKNPQSKGYLIEYYNDNIAKSEDEIISILDKAIKG